MQILEVFNQDFALLVGMLVAEVVVEVVVEDAVENVIISAVVIVVIIALIKDFIMQKHNSKVPVPWTMSTNIQKNLRHNFQEIF